MEMARGCVRRRANRRARRRVLHRIHKAKSLNKNNNSEVIKNINNLLHNSKKVNKEILTNKITSFRFTLSEVFLNKDRINLPAYDFKDKNTSDSENDYYFLSHMNLLPLNNKNNAAFDKEHLQETENIHPDVDLNTQCRDSYSNINYQIDTLQKVWEKLAGNTELEKHFLITFDDLMCKYITDMAETLDKPVEKAECTPQNNSHIYADYVHLNKESYNIRDTNYSPELTDINVHNDIDIQGHQVSNSDFALDLRIHNRDHTLGNYGGVTTSSFMNIEREEVVALDLRTNVRDYTVFSNTTETKTDDMNIVERRDNIAHDNIDHNTEENRDDMVNGERNDFVAPNARTVIRDYETVSQDTEMKSDYVNIEREDIVELHLKTNMGDQAAIYQDTYKKSDDKMIIESRNNGAFDFGSNRYYTAINHDAERTSDDMMIIKNRGNDALDLTNKIKDRDTHFYGAETAIWYSDAKSNGVAQAEVMDYSFSSNVAESSNYNSYTSYDGFVRPNISKCDYNVDWAKTDIYNSNSNSTGIARAEFRDCTTHTTATETANYDSNNNSNEIFSNNNSKGILSNENSNGIVSNNNSNKIVSNDNSNGIVIAGTGDNMTDVAAAATGFCDNNINSNEIVIAEIGNHTKHVNVAETAICDSNYNNSNEIVRAESGDHAFQGYRYVMNSDDIVGATKDKNHEINDYHNEKENSNIFRDKSIAHGTQDHDDEINQNNLNTTEIRMIETHGNVSEINNDECLQLSSVWEELAGNTELGELLLMAVNSLIFKYIKDNEKTNITIEDVRKSLYNMVYREIVLNLLKNCHQLIVFPVEEEENLCGYNKSYFDGLNDEAKKSFIQYLESAEGFQLSLDWRKILICLMKNNNIENIEKLKAALNHCVNQSYLNYINIST